VKSVNLHKLFHTFSYALINTLGDKKENLKLIFCLQGVEECIVCEVLSPQICGDDNLSPMKLVREK
jgi:hypothetical protein